MERKGIILAGGSGTRLYPLTIGTSKQLLPIYDKPMIYYPLSVLMFAGIREIAVITTPQEQSQFKRILEDGSQWGLQITYIEQPSPDGLAQAYTLAEDFLDGAPSAMVLGDNIFFGVGTRAMLRRVSEMSECTIFGHHVKDPERFGVIEFDGDGRACDIVEKPQNPPRNAMAITGMYFLDGDAPRRAHMVEPSERGELEITSLLKTYLDEGALNVEVLGRGFAWFDTGTHQSLLAAGNFVQTLQERQGLQVASPEEIAWLAGWIDDAGLERRIQLFKKTSYGEYLADRLEHGRQ